MHTNFPQSTMYPFWLLRFSESTNVMMASHCSKDSGNRTVPKYSNPGQTFPSQQRKDMSIATLTPFVRDFQPIVKFESVHTLRIDLVVFIGMVGFLKYGRVWKIRITFWEGPAQKSCQIQKWSPRLAESDAYKFGIVELDYCRYIQ